jgi:hypothetical protein
MKYTLQDYSELRFAGYDYKLPDGVNAIIKKLVAEFGTSSTQEARTVDGNDSKFKKPGYFNNSRKPKRNDVSEDTWEKQKAFKATVIEKKEGIEKSINDIRICLNKISNKNYETQRDAIVEYINSITRQGDDSSDDDDEKTYNPNDINSISTAIFEIASTNKFYSELYATLYKELIEKFAVFRDNVDLIIENYKNDIHKIKFVDPNTEYDKFCDNNKLNDKRKAMSMFIVNLMKKGVLEKSTISEIILYLEDIVAKNVDIENMVYEIEEITENLFILVTESAVDFKGTGVWETIMANITLFSKYKAKEHLSISSRAIFKYMDILDRIKNQRGLLV